MDRKHESPTFFVPVILMWTFVNEDGNMEQTGTEVELITFGLCRPTHSYDDQQFLSVLTLNVGSYPGTPVFS